MVGKAVRVLVISTSDTVGGAARAAYRIHQAVTETGIESRMLVKNKGTNDKNVVSLDSFVFKNPFYRALTWALDKVKNKWQHYVWGKYPARSRYYMSDLRSTSMSGALKKMEYDVLHLHWINQRFLPLGSLPKDKPIVWTLHDSWPFCGICHLPFDCKGYEAACGCCPALQSNSASDLSNRVWRRKKNLYKDLELHIVAPSRWLAECARKSSLFKGLDIRVIPNAIDSDLFCPGERSSLYADLGLDSRKHYLLFGAMNALRDDNKGFRFLVEALERVSGSWNQGVELIVFGTDDSLNNQIAGMKVINMGVIHDNRKVASLYKAASITVVPSLSENLSCTIMESLSCGTPVVAFNIGGNNDLIDHKENGYLAKPKDSESMAQGILWCLSNNESGIMSVKARQKVLANYTSKKIGEQYAALYRSLIG
jgi:glycosyltransferase involved in cell wall biosynthesis